MAPQLGLGTFRISHIDHLPHPDDSFATSDGSTVEIWALRMNTFQKPGGANPQVDILVTRMDGTFHPDICGFLTSIGENTANFEVLSHRKTVVTC